MELKILFPFCYKVFQVPYSRRKKWIIKSKRVRFLLDNRIFQCMWIKGFAMKRSIILLLFAGLSVIVSGNALADRHHHHHSRTSVGIMFGTPGWGSPFWGSPFGGSPFWGYPSYSPYYPFYPYAPYYPYPSQTIVIQPSPTRYIQKNNDENAENYWYYCSDPKGYYPYVPKCNANWQKVIPFPQGSR